MIINPNMYFQVEKQEVDALGNELLPWIQTSVSDNLVMITYDYYCLES